MPTRWLNISAQLLVCSLVIGFAAAFALWVSDPFAFEQRLPKWFAPVTTTAQGVAWLRYMGTWESIDEWRSPVDQGRGFDHLTDARRCAKRECHPLWDANQFDPMIDGSAILDDRTLRSIYVSSRLRSMSESRASRRRVCKHLVPGMYEALLARTRYIDGTLEAYLSGNRSRTGVYMVAPASTACPAWQTNDQSASYSSSSASSALDGDSSSASSTTCGTYMHGHEHLLAEQQQVLASLECDTTLAPPAPLPSSQDQDELPIPHRPHPHHTHRRRHSHRIVSCPNAAPIQQLIILGAGFDTRSLTMAPLLHRQNVSVFEVDLPHMQDDKLEHLLSWLSKNVTTFKQLARTPVHVQYVPCDMSNRTQLDDMWHRMRAELGYQPSQRSIVLLEGVAAYLTPHQLGDILRSVHSHVAGGSLLLFDYVSSIALCQSDPATQALAHYVEKMGEPFRLFGEPKGDGEGGGEGGEQVKQRLHTWRPCAHVEEHGEAQPPWPCEEREDMLPCATWEGASTSSSSSSSAAAAATAMAEASDIENDHHRAAGAGADADVSVGAPSPEDQSLQSPLLLPACPCDAQPRLSHTQLDECIEKERMRAFLHEFGMHEIEHLGPHELEVRAFGEVHEDSPHHVGCFERMVLAQVSHPATHIAREMA